MRSKLDLENTQNEQLSEELIALKEDLSMILCRINDEKVLTDALKISNFSEPLSDHLKDIIDENAKFCRQVQESMKDEVPNQEQKYFERRNLIESKRIARKRSREQEGIIDDGAPVSKKQKKELLGENTPSTSSQVNNQDYLGYYVYQNEWNPTRPICPNGAMSSSPGPAIVNLPTTIDGAPVSKKQKKELLGENTPSTSSQVNNQDYLGYYVYQNEWKATRPICPNGAMSSSPGPAIVNLPTTIGEGQHDPTRPKAPGYKIGQRILEYKQQGIGPGPGTYCTRDVRNKSKSAVLAPKFDPAKHFNEKFAGYGGSPGSAAYKRDSADKLIYLGAPTYSVPHAERRETKIEAVPSLGVPNLQQMQRNLDNHFVSNNLHPLQPPYNRILENKGQGIGPGPGTYCTRDVTNKSKSAVLAPKFGPSKHFNEKLAGYGGLTGPATYKRDSADKLIYPGAPTYSVPHAERRETKIETVPSQNVYNLLPLLGKGGNPVIKGEHPFRKDNRMKNSNLDQVTAKKHSNTSYHKKSKK